MAIMKTYDCITCGKTVTKGNTAGKYCSIKCQKENEYKERINNWLNGVGTIGKSTLRRYLTETYGEVCYVCGISSWRNAPLVLEIEHIDGNAYNNSESNLRLICPNCHSQTPTYKNRNKGNGRAANAGSGWLLEKQRIDDGSKKRYYG